ncbi:MAG: PQQ-binding-like beta-propeller repeat protein, partial [Desulfobacterales bacterium]|nr:PQQ-binding-like beta-propeller repeat protein [Desulfobacterales bacterium]
MKTYTFQETGAPIFLKLGVRPSKVRPVALGDRIYTALDGQLLALDATGGKTVQAFGELQSPREILATASRVVMSDTNGIRAFTTGGEPAWSVPEMPKRMVAGGGKVIYTVGNEIVSLDAETGRPLWRVGHEKAGEAVTCTLGSGVLVLERSSWKDDAPGNGIMVFSASTGALLWEKEYTPGMTHWKEARAFFMENLLWLQTNKQKIIGLDPITGKEQKQYVSRGLHCAAPLATENYFIAPEVEFTDLKTGDRSRARMVKSACRLPFVPANGLLYTFPVQCECFPMLRGYMGMAQTPAPIKSTAPRLQPGPARNSAGTVVNGADEWPMYRRDRYRSAYTAKALPEGTGRVLWQSQVADATTGTLAADWEDNPFTGGLVTPPVCA